MPRPKITATLITLNEEQDLPRALQSLRWVDEIIIVDSGSTDKTLEIAHKYGVKTFKNPWAGYGQQKNFAHSQASHDWVLNIDADEEVPSDLAEVIRKELENLPQGSNIHGFSFPRKTFYLGKWIRHGGWYPNRLTRLSRKAQSRWTEPRVHEELIVEGEVRAIQLPFHHYTFRGIGDQVLTNLKYSRYGFEDLRNQGSRPSVAKLLAKPIGKFIETYFFKLGFLDGLAGFIISVNAAHSMFLKYSYFFEKNQK